MRVFPSLVGVFLGEEKRAPHASGDTVRADDDALFPIPGADDGDEIPPARDRVRVLLLLLLVVVRDVFPRGGGGRLGVGITRRSRARVRDDARGHDARRRRASHARFGRVEDAHDGARARTRRDVPTDGECVGRAGTGV